MRVIFPPFQHKAGVTEIDHALDAKALDEAFSELANALNGGLDESNLSAGVKFSTLSPGAPSVSTALADKYSVVTMSRAKPNRVGFGTEIPMGTVIGSGWIPWKASVALSRPTAWGAITFDVFKYAGSNVSLYFSGISPQWVEPGEAAIIENVLTGTVAAGDRIKIDVFYDSVSASPSVHAASVSFLVPVL